MAGRRAAQHSDHPWMDPPASTGVIQSWQQQQAQQQQQQQQNHQGTHWTHQQQPDSLARPHHQGGIPPTHVYQNSSVVTNNMMSGVSSGGGTATGPGGMGGIVDPNLLGSTSHYSSVLAQQQQRQHQQAQQQAPPPPQSRIGQGAVGYPHFVQGSFPPSASPSGGWPQHTGPTTPSVLTPHSETKPFQTSTQTYQAQPASRHPGGSGDTAQRLQPQLSGWNSNVPESSTLPPGADDEDEEEEGSRIKGRQKAGASDFVKKLFTMLDDLSYSSIVSWSAPGDSFIVRNMNDFTKHVLPRHFRHSNFASFVRQLNKYDFHKVKNPEEQSNGPADQIWEFKHPEFVRGREDLLENVRRKLPSGKKKLVDDRDSPVAYNPGEAAERGSEDYGKLKQQIAILTANQDAMSSHISKLTKQYQGVIGEMLTFQRNMVQQDQLMQNLIQYLMNLENDRKMESFASTSNLANNQSQDPTMFNDGPFLSSDDASRIVGSYEQVSDAAFGQLNEFAMRQNRAQQRQQQQQQQQQQQSGAVSAAGASRSTGMVETPSAQHARAPTATSGNLSPKSVATTHSPSGEQPSVLDAYTPASRSEKGKDQASPNNPGDGSDMGIFLHPPHLDNAESNSLFSNAASAVDNPTLAAFENAGLKVFTVGTLQPREGYGADSGGTPTSTLASAFGREEDKNEVHDLIKGDFGLRVPSLENARMPKVNKKSDSTNLTPDPHGEASGSRSDTPSEGGSNTLRVRRSTLVPGWAVPPKVLLVDDDAVCRKLSSKFLQVFGCATDVAVDGVNAVNKMNLEQYDLVLMDVVMPNLDGVSATSLIREFDPKTPIISMTSNSGPAELMNYMSSGMNDILPKPFTKEGLLNMLEKHLIHLKTVQNMDHIPKSLGLPPASKETLQGVLNASAASAASLDAPIRSIPSPSSGGSGKALKNGATMGHGPGVTLVSSPSLGGGGGGGLATNGEDMANPLSEMGFSDEDYINMIQSLLAAGSSSGDMTDTIAGVMGAQRGNTRSTTGDGCNYSIAPSLINGGAGATGASTVRDGGNGLSSVAGRKRAAEEISSGGDNASNPLSREDSSSSGSGAGAKGKKTKSRMTEVKV